MIFQYSAADTRKSSSLANASFISSTVSPIYNSYSLFEAELRVVSLTNNPYLYKCYAFKMTFSEKEKICRKLKAIKSSVTLWYSVSGYL